MTNDITTLNGSLAQLGETLASNITSKGVQASASDGLTTLASKILQISDGGPTIIYSPSLDGTEAITSITARTPTISNNEFGNGCGYLTDGWDNTIDWELTFDYYTTGGYNGYVVIPKGTSSREYNGVQEWFCGDLNFYVQGAKPTGCITGATTCDQWTSVKITKIGYVWTVYHDDVQKTSWDLESYASTVDTWTEMCIGTDRYTDFRSALIKNIVVKTIDDSGCGTTILFEDDCSSSSGLSNYGSSECVRGSNATITMTYDSTENAYQLSGTGNYHAMIPIPTLNDKDNYTITADFKAQNIRFNGIGFFLDNRNDTTSYGQAFWLSVYDKRLDGCKYRLSSDGSGSDGANNSSISANTWYTLEMTVNGDILYAKIYDGNTVLSQSATSLTVENRQMGIFLQCETGSTNSICYVKNIKAESLGR